MKRSILTILFIIGSLFSAYGQSQVFLNFRSGFFKQYDSYQEEDYFRKEVRELNQFRKKVDRFIIAATKEQWSKADFLRSSIVRDMKDEIHQTEMKIRLLERSAVKQRHGNAEIYSKRNTKEPSRKSYKYNRRYDMSEYGYGLRKELLILDHRLETQRRLVHEILRTRIGYGASAWRNVKHIERSMLQFEDLMREEIRQLKADYRDDGWRDHPGRGRNR